MWTFEPSNLQTTMLVALLTMDELGTNWASLCSFPCWYYPVSTRKGWIYASNPPWWEKVARCLLDYGRVGHKLSKAMLVSFLILTSFNQERVNLCIQSAMMGEKKIKHAYPAKQWRRWEVAFPLSKLIKIDHIPPPPLTNVGFYHVIRQHWSGVGGVWCRFTPRNMMEKWITSTSSPFFHRLPLLFLTWNLDICANISSALNLYRLPLLFLVQNLAIVWRGVKKPACLIFFSPIMA